MIKTLLQHSAVDKNASADIAEDLMVRSDTDVLRVTPGMNRSLSAPSGVDDDSLAEVVRLQR